MSSTHLARSALPLRSSALLPSPPSLPPAEHDTRAVLERCAENPSAYLALNAGTQAFRVPGVDGVVAYRPAGRRGLVQLGGVFADPADQPRLLGAFLAFAREQRRRIVAVQLMRRDAELYAVHGFVVNQLGADYARALPELNLRGKPYVALRNKVSRARRAGVTVTEEPWSDGLAAELAHVDAPWLRSKGRHVKELSFMVGETGGAAQGQRRLFIARDAAGEPLAYVSFSPVYGARAGWLHDLSRRLPDAPPGVLELVVVTAVEAFQAEDAGFLHFGFTPFTGLDPRHEVAGHSPTAARIVSFLAAHGSVVYPAASQLAYKEKWGLDVVEPEYVAFNGRLGLRSVWHLLRVTNAV